MLDGLWAVLRRDLVATARQSGLFQGRVVLLILLLLFGVGGGIFRTFPIGFEGRVVRLGEVRAVARGALPQVIGALGLALLAASSDMGLARQRERGTLAKLLTTRLNACEIVVGNFAACLARSAVTVAAVAPVLVLIDALGGIEPGELGLIGAGMASCAFFNAALCLAVSVESRVEKVAAGRVALLTMVWLMIPFLFGMLGPMLVPKLYSWVRPVNLALLAAGPGCVCAHFLGIIPRPSVPALVLGMAAKQTILGLLLMVWAVARLRPAARQLEGAGDPGVGWWRRRKWRSRPACGDDPMDWKERYTSRPGLLVQVLGVVMYVTLFGILCSVLVVLARPAWSEVQMLGYRSAGAGDARWTLNQFLLRPMTGGIALMILMMIVGQTGESFALERARGSWLVLLATPLTGREILGSRRAAMFRRWGPMSLIPATLLAVGLVTGAVHPLGVAASALAWYATFQLALALGGYLAVRAAEGKTQEMWSGLALVLLVFVVPFLPRVCGRRHELAPVAALSPPFLASVAPLTFPDVGAVLDSGTSGEVFVLGLAARPGGAGWLALTVVLGPVLILLAARGLDRATDRKFNPAVGRTDREHEPGETEDSGRSVAS